MAGGYSGSQAAAVSHRPVSVHQLVSATTGSTIGIHSFAFHTPISVRPGATVTVVNHDGTTHSVTRNGGGFSVIVPAHSTRTFRAPRAAGNYGFHCMFHSDMHATLRVRR
jgi:plastocyanin